MKIATINIDRAGKEYSKPAALKEIFLDLKLISATSEIPENIDHIVIPEAFTDHISDTGIFMDKNTAKRSSGDFYFHRSFLSLINIIFTNDFFNIAV